MADKTLLRSQKNEVFRVVQEAGLDLSMFRWAVLENKNFSTSRLDYSSDGFFSFSRLEDGRYYSIFSPAEYERQGSRVADDWPGQFSHVEDWAKYLKREFQEPDLWTTITEEKQLAEGASTTDNNSPFTPQERERIAADIGEIKEFLFQDAIAKPSTAEVRGRATKLFD